MKSQEQLNYFKIEEWLNTLSDQIRSDESLSCAQLLVTPWAIAHQAPLFIEFSRQEYWNGFPFPSPGDLPYPGIEPRTPAAL